MHTVNIGKAAQRLQHADDIWILTHKNPDGDTLGSAFALRRALTGMGKRAEVLCPDELPWQYDFLYPPAGECTSFEPGFILAVDLATASLMGRYENLAPRVDLCIDHHPGGGEYAKETCLSTSAAAAGELVLDILTAMQAPIDNACADALYLALSSDTGGFRYTSTTAETHRKAARLIEMGARSAEINRLLFENKPRGLVAVEGALMMGMKYYHNDMCAVISLPLSLLSEHGLAPIDTDGLASLPSTVSGVEVGITLRERAEGGWRVSLRTTHIDAGELCRRFGGGGHRMAAGCTFECTLEQAMGALVEAAGDALRAGGLL